MPTINSPERTVLIFCHGSGFTKATWEPILRRLEVSPLLQHVQHEIVTFDWRYHGENYDHALEPNVSFRDGNKRSPRVEHPTREWTEWAHQDLLERIEAIRKNDSDDKRTRIVGIGHSMGASALLQVELAQPGSLDGLIGFEPVYVSGALTDDQWHKAVDLLVSVSMARQGQWSSVDEAAAHLKEQKLFRRWHPEALDAYLKTALIRSDNDATVKLATTPLQEAATYCHKGLVYGAEEFSRAQCKLFIEHSERSFFFYPEQARAVAEKLPGKFIIGEAIPNTTHGMVFEDPEMCAQRILSDLAQLPGFEV